MITLIRRVIGSKESERSDSEVTSNFRTLIAACVILLEAAHADNECTDEEISHILDTIKSTFELTHEYADELLELAREEREEAIELWQFTNTINQEYTREEKLQVMEAVWRIIYADGQLEKHEDHLANKLAYLMHLSHREKIETKLRAKESFR
jgi:uncharacterized tellurite resistance protein B-like protein